MMLTWCCAGAVTWMVLQVKIDDIFASTEAGEMRPNLAALAKKMSS